MNVLGLHGSFTREHEDAGAGYGQHDSAAVLIQDGQILAAVEEERLNRVKHSNFFPLRSIRFCLEQAGLELGEVDRIALNLSQRTLDTSLISRAMRHPGEPIVPAQAYIGALLAKEFQVNVTSRIRFHHHHMAHAASAYFASGYDRALVVTLDGDGDGLCGMVLSAREGRFERLHEVPDSQSLGNWYTYVSRVLGYTRFDEYKVMGLAPLGDPAVFADLFKNFYRLLPGGEYEIRPAAEHLYHLQRAGLLARARRKDEPFTQMHRDLAAALQAALEEIALHVIHHFRDVTGEENLCLAGGVVHNCSMNGKILYSGLFQRVFAQPVCHDAGTALGAAWLSLQEEGGELPGEPMRHVYFGPDLAGQEEIERALAAWNGLVTCERLPDVAARTAELLAGGSVVGWVQGRSEFGPRALGNRSILADPRPADNKDLINRMIKKREGYRPFAPSVVEEQVGEFFVTSELQAEFPFMIFVLDVRPQWRETLGAITHVDGTARVHTVSRRENPLYWELLGEFGERTGVPMLLNTSFNNHAEPIVDSVEDAVICYLTTGLHYLVVGDWLVSKRGLDDSDPAWAELAPGLRLHRKLVRRSTGTDPAARVRYQVESTANDFFCESAVPVAEEIFHLLLAADGRRSAAELMDEFEIAEEERRRAITRDLVDLCARRIVILRPSCGGAGC